MQFMQSHILYHILFDMKRKKCIKPRIERRMIDNDLEYLKYRNEAIKNARIWHIKYADIGTKSFRCYDHKFGCI